MTVYERYKSLCQELSNLDITDFFNHMAYELEVTNDTIGNIHYAVGRSWFKPEMVDELIRLNDPKAEGYRPNLYSGNFDWNEIDGRFVPNEG